MVERVVPHNLQKLGLSALHNGAKVFCFLSSLPLLLSPTTTAVFGSYYSSLYSKLTLYCRSGLAYSYDWRGFVEAKKKTSVVFSVFNSSMTIRVTVNKGCDHHVLQLGLWALGTMCYS